MDGENTTDGVHWSFWVIGAVTLIWNVFGVVNYFAQMDPELLSAYREAERAIVANRPVWATAGFATAVFGGTLGCLLLLFRRSAAFYFFILSLLGVIITTIYSVSLDIQFGVGEIAGIIAMPVIVAIFLIWYYRFSVNKGWIKQ